MKINVRQVINKSKTGQKLDPQKIKKIMSLLNRIQLRQYLILLREVRKKELVVIETPISSANLGIDITHFFKKIFKDKDLDFVEDKNLIGGIRVTVNDDILDLSFKGILQRLYDYDR